MEKKYYDLIVSLIKKHKKFAGCEAILDDIAEDVYDHAKVILDTIEDENVITSYLTKVVATSIITVPKKLNINTRIAHKVIMPELKDIEPVVKNEIKIDVPEPEKTDIPEFSFDEIIEEITEEAPSEPEKLDEYADIEELEADLNANDSSEDITEVSPAEEEEEEEEPVFEADDNTLNKVLDESPSDDIMEEIPEPDVNKELVDKMINSAENVSSESDDEINADEIENITEILVDESDSSLENNEPAEEDEFSLEEMTDDSLLEAPEEDFSLGDVVTEDTLTETQEIINNAQESPDDSAEFTPPNYKKFNFEPNIESNNNSDEINEYLLDLDTKRPELHALQVCELKYKENKSIEEIAEILGLDTEAVIESLSEIIYAIKD